MGEFSSKWALTFWWRIEVAQATYRDGTTFILGSLDDCRSDLEITKKRWAVVGMEVFEAVAHGPAGERIFLLGDDRAQTS